MSHWISEVFSQKSEMQLDDPNKIVVPIFLSSFCCHTAFHFLDCDWL